VSPPPSQLFGVYSGVSFYTPGSDQINEVDQMANLHTQVCRMQMNWHTIEAGATKPESKDWTQYDDLVTHLVSHGITPVFAICGAPEWACGWGGYPYHIPGTGNDATYQAYVTKLATFCGEAATRYATTVNHWQIWNEPNDTYFWHEQDVSGALYAEMYKPCHVAIHAANANAIVCGPPLSSPYVGGLNPVGHPDVFLPAFWEAGALPDAIGVHLYQGGESVAHAGEVAGPSETTAWQDSWVDISRVRDLMVAAGQSAAPIWMTEFAWKGETTPDTGSTTFARQAEYLTYAYNSLISTYTYVTIATWFLMSELYADAQYRGYGLYDYTDTITLAGTAFHDFMESQ
jgi:hypothetical protein